MSFDQLIVDSAITGQTTTSAFHKVVQ